VIQDGLATGHAHILVRLDANHRIGLGHAVRVSGILRLLKVPHRITVAGAGELITDFFPGQRLLLVHVEDHNAFFSLIGEIQPDLVLVDHPRPGHGFWHGLSVSAGDIPVVSIDDEGGEVDADLVINGTVLEQYHRYPLLRPRAKLLAGRDYSLIRPVFGETPWRNPAESSVVIVAGSGDRAHDWALYLLSGEIDLSSWGTVRMIVGRAFPDMPRLQHDCDALGVILESGLSGEGMAEALSQASVALITGGMIVYEALAVGVPAIVFPQIENLIPEARWFAERGCIVNLGHGRGSNFGQVSVAVGRLLSSPSARLVMSLSQRATIDGHGMVRAAQAIDGVLADRTTSDGRCSHWEQKARP
jgi:spore coat polysaccharide biosynthesis predicted glycosyltransferase SpsG